LQGFGRFRLGGHGEGPQNGVRRSVRSPSEKTRLPKLSRRVSRLGHMSRVGKAPFSRTPTEVRRLCAHGSRCLNGAEEQSISRVRALISPRLALKVSLSAACGQRIPAFRHTPPTRNLLQTAVFWHAVKEEINRGFINETVLAPILHASSFRDKGERNL
jgi:hypothetical protein